MTTVKAVKDPEADPKLGKTRAKSGVSFPYFDLESCVEVAKVIHERAGGVCDLAQLAALLSYSGVRNGSFRVRVAATKMFGLIEDADDQRVRVSQRGLAVVAPVGEASAARAKLDAFMAVELFKKVYDQFHGTTLPEQVGLRNLFQTEYQVVPDRIIPTIRIMMESAEHAGLFRAAGRSRMVMPLMPSPSGGATELPPPSAPRSEGDVSSRLGGGSGGGDGGGIDPAILGLLKRLPPGGTPMSAKRRKALIDAFTNVVGFIYPDADDE